MEYNFCINGIPFQKDNINIDVFTFPGGEPHVKLDTFKEELPGAKVNISVRLNSFNDLGKLLILCDAIKNLKGSINTIYIPYFPGARQDKKVIAEAFTVKIYADIINNLGANEIVICDPHSEVAPGLLNNVKILSQEDIWKKYIKEQIVKNQNFVYISPDQGASKKTKLLAGNNEIIYCTKQRDLKTGRLSGFTVNANSLKAKHGIIIDDICDGGGTFIGLAKELRKKGMEKLTLCVTHGIFSKGFEVLWEYFDSIHTTNSIKSHYPKEVKMLNLKFND